MKTAPYGRILFGASAVIFGVIALLWHDPYTWQSLYKILKLPFGAIVGACLMIAQIVGGAGLPFARTVRAASIVLVVVYALFSLACVPGIVAHPKAFGEYGSFFEQFSLVCGAFAAYAAATAGRFASLGRIARLGLGVCAVSFAVDQIAYLRLTAGLVPAWIPPNQTFWAILTTVAFALAALAIFTNIRALLALRLMTLMLVIFGAIVWIPLVVAHPDAHINWSECVLTFLIAGASWTVADATAP